MSRLLSFDAIDNFRDYGDYATAAGRRVRPGRLYRSAHHARATDADLDKLAALNLGTIVDLRRPGERRQQPSRRAPGFAGQVVQTDLDDGAEAPHLAFLKSADLTEASGRDFMHSAYRRIPFEPQHLDLFTRHFRALAEGDGPVLIHCAAGKDRTGLLAALTHHVLGVSRDDMIEDYLLTNAAVDLDARAPKIARQLEQMTGRRASHGAVVAFLGVEPDFLDVAFRAIEAEHGGLDAYLERALGVDAALRDRIEDRLAA